MQIFFKPTHTVDSLISTQTLSLSWMILKVNFSAQRETENKVSSHRAGVKRAPVFSLSALSSQLRPQKFSSFSRDQDTETH